MFSSRLMKPLIISRRLCNIHDIVTNNSVTLKNEANVLQNPTEDLSQITPYFSKTFNIAAYVNKSETLQNFVHLNVNLHKIEKKPYIVEKILKLDFEENVKHHIMFLKSLVNEQDMGEFITKNPLILCETIEDLQVRINYLKSKRFLTNDIKRIINKNPFWLMFNTKRIDKRLGYYQKTYRLSGKDVRYLATKQPKLITYNLHHIRTNSFVIKEEMGFEDREVKQLLLHKPRLWMINQKDLLRRFNYLHNNIGISHIEILHYPEVLLCRLFRLKQRHLFLEKLGRAQYDPRKPNYVPIKALVENTDKEFCKEYCKCNVDDFNIFLKTL